MDPTELDQASLHLIIQLQVQDVESMLKGKHKPGEAPDSELALETLRTDLESLSAFANDRALTRSIARAVVADGDAIKEHTAAERLAAHDREVAHNLETPNANAARVAAEEALEARAAEEAIEDEMLNKLVALYIGEDVSVDQGESSSHGASRASVAGTEDWRICMACRTDVLFFDVVRCPCSHEYCRDCIADLFTACIDDESLFPPRCCNQPIPLGLNQIFLPHQLVGEYLAKELEYSTPNRTYCHMPACSRFVPVQFIREDVATCVQCQSRTCVICKAEAHEGDCPADEATLDTLRLATENGWQRCYSCRGVVELNVGCNHITCRCGAHFCYTCGVKWKECRCEMWEEHRLMDRANHLVDRDVQGPGLRGPQRDAMVERARVHLVENHECDHERWKSRGGAHQCEECHHVLPTYIYECRDCRILACRRCRFNRL